MAEQQPTVTYPGFTSLGLREGLFDQLMIAMKAHIHEEYKQQRITSADYSRVFLGIMEAALANTTQFLMAGLLLDLQKAKLEAEIRLIDLEGEKLRYEIDYLYPLKVAQLELENQKLAIDVEKLRFEIDYLYPAQLIKLQQEGLLIEAQVRLADANVDKVAAEIEKIAAEILMLESQKLLIDAQIAKINQEILFLTAKIATEWANTKDGFDPGSVIGRQTTLLKAQQLGFSGELHAKVSKLHGDYAAVYESVNELGVPELTGLATGAAATAIATHIGNLS